MRWKRVDNTKEKNEAKDLITQFNKEGFLQKIKKVFQGIKYKIIDTYDNIKEKMYPEEKPSFYHIEVKGSGRLNKKKVIITAVVLALIVVIITIGTLTMISKNEEEKREEEAKKIIEIKQQEEEIAKIEKEKEAARQAKLPKLTQTGINNMDNIYKSETKRVFLTFDDGPSSNTAPILDILKQENIKATFFELGNRVEAQPDLVKRTYDEGHYIASHGYTHVYSQIYTSADSVLAEYTQCVQAIKNAIGESEYEPHLFRFPGGLAGGKYAEIKAQAKQLLIQNQILNVDWNALSGDAEANGVSVEKLMARTDETVKNQNSVVILMHDSQEKVTTVEALPQIIAYFRDRGYEFKNFYEIIK